VKAEIESTEINEHVSVNQQTGGCDNLESSRLIDSRMIGREAGVDVAWQTILANGDSGMLNGAIGEQQLAPDRGSFGMAGGIRSERFEPAGLGQGVIIQKNYLPPTGCRRARIAARRKSAIGGVADDPDLLLIRSQQFGGRIGGGVVNNDDFGLMQFGGLCQQRVEALTGY
jgi:hypothetical protein